MHVLVMFIILRQIRIILGAIVWLLQRFIIAIYTMATISAFFPAVNLRVCVSSEGLPEPRNTIPKVDEGKKSEI